MKKLSISLVALSMSMLAFSQHSHPGYEDKYLDISLSNPNSLYLHEVQNNLTPNHARKIENLVSTWNVAGLDTPKRGWKYPLEVTFKSSRGYIIVTYDRQGSILSTVERFKDIAVPSRIGVSLLRKYPDWHISKTRFSLVYTGGQVSKKHLKVQLKKGNLREWVIVDLLGKSS